MESLMKINALLIKQLRDERAWSQEHLAEVAGLSLRTVQRVEAEGSASAETRMALASALGLSAATLALKEVPAAAAAPTATTIATQPQSGAPATSARGRKFGLSLGLGGATLGAILACVGIANSGGTPAEAGMSYGIVGLVFGLTCATMGIMSRFLTGKSRAK